MATNDKITELNELTTPANDDVLAIVDKSDTAQSAEGSTKKIKKSNFLSGFQSQGDVLDDLNALGVANTDGQFIVATGAGAFAYENGATARTSLGLGTGNSPQFTNLILSGHLQGTTGNGYLKLRGDSGAANNVKIYDSGIVDLEGQSCARIQLSSSQMIPDSQNVVCKWNSEDWDIQGEFDSSVNTGTADATETSKLHDADGGFDSSMVGATVWNTTDNTYATVFAFVDSGELTLTNHIFTSGEGYEIFWSRFVATQAGKYLVTGGVRWGANSGGIRRMMIFKNGNRDVILFETTSTSASYQIGTGGSAMVELSANDYIQLIVYQDRGGITANIGGSNINHFSITKQS